MVFTIDDHDPIKFKASYIYLRTVYPYYFHYQWQMCGLKLKWGISFLAHKTDDLIYPWPKLLSLQTLKTVSIIAKLSWVFHNLQLLFPLFLKSTTDFNWIIFVSYVLNVCIWVDHHFVKLFVFICGDMNGVTPWLRVALLLQEPQRKLVISERRQRN